MGKGWMTGGVVQCFTFAATMCRSLGKPGILLVGRKTTMIEQLSIRNFKSIGDQQDIPMGPLVALVGVVGGETVLREPM